MEIWTEIIKIIPAFLWFFIILFLIIKFYKPLRYELLPKLSDVKTMGIELSFIKTSIDAALDLAEKNPQWKVEVTPFQRENVLNRAGQHRHIFQNAKILWVDDVPKNNRNELKMFKQLNVKIKFVKTTEEALNLLEKRKFDVVLSDIARDDDKKAGLKFLKLFREKDEATPVIFYVGDLFPEKGIPPRAFGITNRPDELLHLVLDALERKKY